MCNEENVLCETTEDVAESSVCNEVCEDCCDEGCCECPTGYAAPMDAFEIPEPPAFETLIIEAETNGALQSEANEWLATHKTGYGIAQVQYVPAGDNNGKPAVFILYQCFEAPEDKEETVSEG